MTTRSKLTGKVALKQRIRNFAQSRGLTEIFVETLLSHYVVFKIIQDSQVEGWNTLRARGGFQVAMRTALEHSRFTKDLDLLGLIPSEQNLKNLEGLSTGIFQIKNVNIARQPNPVGIPETYRIKRLGVQVFVKGSLWRTVRLELGIDELEMYEFTEQIPPSAEILELLELAEISEVSLPSFLSLEYQLAQKVHGITEPGSERGHDLYDIWLLSQLREIDAAILKDLILRTFAYRKTHPWTGEIFATEKLERSYVEEVGDIPTAPDFSDALKAVNQKLLALI